MRIIAGKYRGRKLLELTHLGTRPTIDRVREAIFSKIQFDIKDGVVLDLFSGTGAMSFEALSRGAKVVYSVDNSKESYELIKQNNDLLKENLNIICADFKTSLLDFKKQNKTFDVIFLDPPYESDYAEYSLEFIATNNLLNDNGVIVWEHNKDKNNFIIPNKLIIYDEKKYGTVFITYITLNE